MVTDQHDPPGRSSAVSGAREAWDERYSTQGMVWGIDANTFVKEHLSELSARRVLDLGCGQGRNAIWFAARGHTVTGLDLSPVAIDQARRLADTAGVEVDFRAVDIARTWRPEPDAYDLIVLSYLQLPPTTRPAVHAKAIAALAPGGMAFLIAHHADNIEQGVGGPPYPEVLFSEAQLADDFAGLDIRRNEKVFRTVDKEGVSGQAHDILLVAYKGD